MTKTLAIALTAFAALAAGMDGVTIGARPPAEKVIKLTAKRFAFSPEQITARKGETIVIEIDSEDVRHGFTLPDFGIRADIKPGVPGRVRFTPDKTGRFTFACDVFCGEGHEDMSGTLIVSD